MVYKVLWRNMQYAIDDEEMSVLDAGGKPQKGKLSKKETAEQTRMLSSIIICTKECPIIITVS